MAAATILVVDDEPGVRSLLRRCLEGDGYAVIESEDISDVLSRVREGGVDLITLDLNLGGESGIEIAVTSHAGQVFVRLSVQGYNTRDDVTRLIDAPALR